MGEGGPKAASRSVRRTSRRRRSRGSRKIVRSRERNRRLRVLDETPSSCAAWWRGRYVAAMAIRSPSVGPAVDVALHGGLLLSAFGIAADSTVYGPHAPARRPDFTTPKAARISRLRVPPRLHDSGCRPPLHAVGMRHDFAFLVAPERSSGSVRSETPRARNAPKIPALGRRRRQSQPAVGMRGFRAGYIQLSRPQDRDARQRRAIDRHRGKGVR
jgi:hypothetical protein